MAWQGWYIQYIDRDPRALARQEALAKMKKHELNEEDRRRRHIAKQVAAAQAASDGYGCHVVAAPSSCAYAALLGWGPRY